MEDKEPNNPSLISGTWLSPDMGYRLLRGWGGRDWWSDSALAFRVSEVEG